MAIKSLQNRAYRSGRLLHALNGDQIWTTNTYIAEVGEVEPRTYKDTDDQRPAQAAGDKEKPKLDSILPTATVPVEKISEPDENGFVQVYADGNSWPFNSAYTDYLQAKYPDASMELQSWVSSAIMVFKHSGEPVAMVMGIRK